MSQIIKNTIRIGHAALVMMTLLAMLFVSSAQELSEECSEETVSQEIELVLSRRDEQGAEPRSKFGFQQCVCVYRKSSHVDPPRVTVIGSERVNMNGTGSYLRI